MELHPFPAGARRNKYLSEARMRSDLTNLPYGDP
jgi:hypothetical protein